MKSITEAIKSFFKQEGIKFEQVGRDSIFKLGFVGDSGCFLGYVNIDEEQRALYIRTLAPVRVPTSKRQKLAELLMRFNQRLLLGGFDLNMNSGLIAYKTSIILGEGNLHDDIIEHLLFANWWAIDKYFPAINMVIFGNISPKPAIEKVKGRRGPAPDSSDDTDPGEFFRGRLGNILGGSLN
jgi:hypothetical protein